MNIRKASPNDVSSILSLINELATFENEPEAVIISEKDLLQDGFGPNPLFEVLVGEIENEVIGMAFYYPRYSTWKGKTLHLEDLIVKQNYRGKGYGFELYKAFIKEAHEQQVQRIEWVVLDWNTSAINLYTKSGATVFDEWKTVQMNQTAIQTFINQHL